MNIYTFNYLGAKFQCMAVNASAAMQLANGYFHPYNGSWQGAGSAFIWREHSHD
jgi:hypothetical protein